MLSEPAGRLEVERLAEPSFINRLAGPPAKDVPTEAEVSEKGVVPVPMADCKILNPKRVLSNALLRVSASPCTMSTPPACTKPERAARVAAVRPEAREPSSNSGTSKTLLLAAAETKS